MLTLPRVAIVCDFQEENWPSMDLVSEMLFDHLQKGYSDVLSANLICPPMRMRFAKKPTARGERESGMRLNADRFVNRFWDYPRFMRRLESEFDLFHVIDHSYGQLLHELPPEQTIVTCHDLDTFQCLLYPEQEPRSIFFRKMMERTLSGFRKAALVTCVSVATREELLSNELFPPERTVVIPNGVHPSCSAEENRAADAEADTLIGAGDSRRFDMLHVGSTIPRKRIDILLRVFATVKHLYPSARLLRVGGAFTAEQTALIERLRLRESILVLPYIDRDVLAAVYRRAALVLLPSEREGFGLPVVEAMACGTPVVASDLPVLREVGCEAATYCEMGNVEAWTNTIAELLTESHRQPQRWAQRREAGLAQAAKFTWAEYARRMVAVYQSVLR
jgi:glycosyltransferase involved in cell wall biosynthesis